MIYLIRRLKRAVIKEELVELTGDFKKAVILNQLIYWSERVKDFDKFIEEERQRMKMNNEDLNMDLQNGWIYKTAEELSEETMLGLSPSNMRKHIKVLVDNGWLSERTNPKYKWDKTKQYRVNITKIQKDLNKLGYALNDYPLSQEVTEALSFNAEHHETENGDNETEIQDTETANQTAQNAKTIPEITTEITTEVVVEPPKQQEPSVLIDTNLRRLVKTFEECGFGTITAFYAETLTTLCDDYSVEWVDLAMQKAAILGKRNLGYVRGILQGWRADGGPNMSSKKANEEKKQKARHEKEWEESQRYLQERKKKLQKIKHELAQQMGVDNIDNATT